MEGKKVVFFEVEPWEQDFFRHHLESKADFTFYPHRLTEANLEEAEAADVLVTFIYSDLSSKVLERLRSLKGIVTMSVGTDHIDLEETMRRNIVVSNVPNYGPQTVAEHTIALLLALSRNIVPSVERTRMGEYDYTGLTGWDLMGKTIGIIGTGKIGSHVAQIAQGLGMKIIGYDPHPNSQVSQKTGLEYMSLEQLLNRSDVVTIHIPLIPETRHMLSQKEFAQMKKGVVFLNTARGGLVDPSALLEAINNGTVKQAGIDVLDDEGLLKEEKQFFSRYFQLKDYQTALADHALMHDPRVLVTPHNAFNSKESLHNILKTAVEDIEGILTSDPVNVVDKK